MNFSFAKMAGIVVAMIATVIPAKATLTLTQTAIADGFSLSTFVSGYSAQYGPLAQGISSNGQVITGSLLNTKIYVFDDVDGQKLSNAVNSVSYTCITGNCNFAMATAGSQVYGAQLQGGVYEKFNSDGTFAPIASLQAAGLRDNLGMWGNPVNGHIISASTQGLVDIDPVAGTFRVIVPNIFPDGVTVSPDGTIAYVENGGTIQSYNIATGALLHTYATGHSPDGTGVISSNNNLNGDVIVNNNDGTVGLLDPTKANGDPSQFVIIANNGTRGDFVSPDLNNGTLFLSQTDQVARLSCGPDCSIGGVPSTTPEPASWALFGAGLVSVECLRRRVNRRA